MGRYTRPDRSIIVSYINLSYIQCYNTTVQGEHYNQTKTALQSTESL